MKNMLKHIRDIARSQKGLRVGGKFFTLPLGVPITIDELWMRDAIKTLLPEADGVFLDIGVNLGQTLLSLRSIDENFRYVGFEPNPYCISEVDKVVRANKILNTTLIPLACSDEFGISVLYHYLDSSFDSSATMVNNFRPSLKPLRETIIGKGAAVECLQAVGVDRVGIVKIDVEGFEADVLEAIEPVLKRDRPPILIEILPIRADQQRINAQKRIVAVLERIGYVSRRVKKSSSGYFEGLSEILVPGLHSEVIDSDYCFLCKSSAISVE